MTLDEDYSEMQFLSKSIQLELATGKLKWEDEKVQFFIPVALYFTEIDWLKLIAENCLVEEDTVVVNNFLELVQGLMNVNAQQLNTAVAEKIKRLFEDD